MYLKKKTTAKLSLALFLGISFCYCFFWIFWIHFSPTAECFGVFSHSKGFGAHRSSSKTHSPKVQSKGSQVKVPRFPSKGFQVPRFPSKGSQGSLKVPKVPKVPQGSLKVPKRFPKGSLKVPSRFPARFPSFPSKGCQGSQDYDVKVPK